MLPLLLSLQIKTCESAEILLTNSLIHGRSSFDSFTIVVGRIRPPIGLGFDVANDHVFYSSRQAWNLPRNVGFPAAPGFAQMLKDSLCFVLLDSFRHHVIDVLDYSSSQLQVILTFNSLLGDCLGNALRMSTFKLSRQQVSKPAFQ